MYLFASPLSEVSKLPLVSPNTSVGHDSILANISYESQSAFQVSASEAGASQVIPFNQHPFKIGSIKTGISQIAINDFGISQVSFNQSSVSQVGSPQADPGENRISQVGTTEIGFIQANRVKDSPAQIGFTQVDPLHVGVGQFQSAEINTSQISTNNVVTDIEPIASEVSNSSSVEFKNFSILQQWFSDAHDQYPADFIDIDRVLRAVWPSLLENTVTSNLTFEVKDLPYNQLAETQIFRFGSDGHATEGTIYIDDDANGTGWFIDLTPWESSEFSTQNTEYNFEASEGSAAYGRYDLLTTILHELSHFAGFIAGHEHFDALVEDGVFRNGDLTTSITADGSHIAGNPLSLLSPYLTPGMRKLPSELEMRILEAIRNHDGPAHTHGPITAAQTAILTGIANGDFEQLLDQWNHRGTVTTTSLGASFNTSTAVTLTEDSPILSQLSQTFVIPQDASQRYLTFDLLETTLGSTTHRPPDAFEVALLDATTLKPLVGTAIGLTNTDALLNLQSNGTLYLDDDVTVTALGNGHRRVRIDLGDLAPSTTATLYFDLLGFGAADSRITIDNITFGKGSTPPVATDDTATLTQGQSTPLNLLTNDTADQPLTPSQITLATNPTHGSLTRDEQGNLIYNPFDGYAGIDSFTYRLTGSDGETSNLATVNLEILNAAPQIQTIALPTTATEGTPLSFTAAATDPGNDTLTYTWTFSDGSPSLTGQTIAHTFADNGDYTVTLTVSDPYGGTTSQTQTLSVDNTAPTITAITGSTIIDEGQSIQLSAIAKPSKGIATDPGNNILTYEWNFGGGSGQSSAHRFTGSEFGPVDAMVRSLILQVFLRLIYALENSEETVWALPTLPTSRKRSFLSCPITVALVTIRLSMACLTVFISGLTPVSQANWPGSRSARVGLPM